MMISSQNYRKNKDKTSYLGNKKDKWENARSKDLQLPNCSAY